MIETATQGSGSGITGTASKGGTAHLEWPTSRRNLTRWLVLLAAALGALFSLVVAPAAMAQSVDATTFIGANDPLVAAIVRDVNANQGVEILSYDANDGTVRFSNSTYVQLDSAVKRSYMEAALTTIEKSDLSKQRRSKLYNFVYDQDTAVTAIIRQFSSDSRADAMGAFAILAPFNGVIGTVLGIICVLILMFLGISFVLDLAYIVLPWAQTILGPNDAHAKPKFISSEAYTAMKVSEESAGTSAYKLPIWIYLKKRVVSVALISLVIMYLISGQLFSFLGFFADIFN